MVALDAERIEARLAAEGWMDLPEPGDWVGTRLNERLWSKQEEITESVVANRYTAVPSAHDTGKSYIASRLAAWWLDVHATGDAFVVTTAPTQTQVHAILWREMRAAHRRGKLKGRTTLDDHWYMGEDELVAYGRKPADYADPEKAAASFSGIHARFVLIIIDEASGIPKWLWDAVDTLATNEHARVLTIGNPDDPASQFEKVCRPGSGWNVIPISAFDTPAFTGEQVEPALLEQLVSPTWVEERKRRWGEDSNLYVSKVLGRFPETSDDTLISMARYREACEREAGGVQSGQYGVDFARSGSDESVIYRNRGGRVRFEWAKRGTDMKTTTQTKGEVRRRIEPAKGRIPAVIDVIGIGAGPYDDLSEQGLNVVAFNASERARDPKRFKNKRAEAYWELRELFDDGVIDLDPADEDLGAQLTAIRYFIGGDGRIGIESKEDMKKRGVASPDRADAVMMACRAAPGWTMPKSAPDPHPGLANDLLGRQM